MNCPICLEPSPEFRTRCNHEFHRSCLLGWQRANYRVGIEIRTCPICRQNIEDVDIYYRVISWILLFMRYVAGSPVIIMSYYYISRHTIIPVCIALWYLMTLFITDVLRKHIELSILKIIKKWANMIAFISIISHAQIMEISTISTLFASGAFMTIIMDIVYQAFLTT